MRSMRFLFHTLAAAGWSLLCSLRCSIRRLHSLALSSSAWMDSTACWNTQELRTCGRPPESHPDGPPDLPPDPHQDRPLDLPPDPHPDSPLDLPPRLPTRLPPGPPT